MQQEFALYLLDGATPIDNIDKNILESFCNDFFDYSEYKIKSAIIMLNDYAIKNSQNSSTIFWQKLQARNNDHNAIMHIKNVFGDDHSDYRVASNIWLLYYFGISAKVLDTNVKCAFCDSIIINGRCNNVDCGLTAKDREKSEKEFSHYIKYFKDSTGDTINNEMLDTKPYCYDFIKPNTLLYPQKQELDKVRKDYEAKQQIKLLEEKEKRVQEAKKRKRKRNLFIAMFSLLPFFAFAIVLLFLDGLPVFALPIQYIDIGDRNVSIVDVKQNVDEQRLILPSHFGWLFAKRVTQIETRAFDSNDNIKEIVVPSSIQIIDSFAFANSDNLSRVFFEHNTPPQLWGNLFGEYDNINLFVPYDRYSNYANHKDFSPYIDRMFPTVKVDSDKFVVFFYDNEAENLIDSSHMIPNIELGSTVELPKHPEHIGYTFNGWFTKINGELGTAFSNLTPVMQDTIVYPNWYPTTYKIRYETNGGYNHPNNSTTSYTIHDNDIVIYPAQKDGNTFDGWYLDNDFSTKLPSNDKEQAIISGSYGDITLYAKWRVNQYQIKLNALGGTVTGDNISNNIMTISFDDPIELSKIIPKWPETDDPNYGTYAYGHMFGGWYSQNTIVNPPKNTNEKINWTTVPNLGDDNASYEIFVWWKPTYDFFVVSGNEILGFSLAWDIYEGDEKNYISLPKGGSVNRIANAAFKDITTLKHITMDENYISIGDEAFQNAGLQSIKAIGITSIGARAFQNNKDLKIKDDIYIPQAQEIGDDAFSGTDYLEIKIPNSNPFAVVGKVIIKYKPSSFEKLEIKNTDLILYNELGDKITTIGKDAFNELNFNGAKIEYTINIPENIARIEQRAFTNSNLKEVNIPNSMQVIGEFAFAGTSITKLVIPASTSLSIGESAFKDCNLLSNITFGLSSTQTAYPGIDLAVLFGGDSPETLKNIVVLPTDFSGSFWIHGANAKLNRFDLVDTYSKSNVNITHISIANFTISELNLYKNNLQTINTNDTIIGRLNLAGNRIGYASEFDISPIQASYLNLVGNGVGTSLNSGIIAPYDNPYIKYIFMPNDGNRLDLQDSAYKDNELQHLDFLEFLPNIKSIDAANNEVESLPYNWNVNTQLEELYLGGNPILDTSFIGALGHLPNKQTLKRLNLGYNGNPDSFGNYAFYIEFLEECSNLEWLEIYGLNIFEILNKGEKGVLTKNANPNLKRLKISSTSGFNITTLLEHFRQYGAGFTLIADGIEYYL